MTLIAGICQREREKKKTTVTNDAILILTCKSFVHVHREAKLKFINIFPSLYKRIYVL